MWQFWLIAAGIFFIAEIFTVGFMIFWFGVGALITMLISFFISDIIIQTTIFIIVSAILLFATRPFVNKFIHTDSIKTNAFSIIGKKGIVIEDIKPLDSTGQIKVDKEIWSAESLNEQNIPKGSEVEIISINGVKAIVNATKIATLNK